MSKKQVSQKQDVHSTKFVVLNQLFDGGNFFLLRKLARETISAPDSNDKERAFAQHMLMVTWPDARALVAGGACLVFSLLIAYISAY